MSRTLARSTTGLALLAALLFVPLTAWAHGSVESGSFVFEIGWLQEPVIQGERNGLELFIAPKDAPEEGIADITTLQFSVEYGGASRSFGLVPAEHDPGHYSAAFIPTIEGQYTFHLTGTINDEAVDVSFDPEEVVSDGVLAFPSPAEAASSSGDNARTLALAALVLAAGAIVLSGFALLRRKA